MSSVCSFLVIFGVTSNVHPGFVGPPLFTEDLRTCNESTAFTSTLIQAALAAHNLHRRQAGDAADMLKLVWSDQVASIAQNDASQRTLNPNSQCDYNGLTTNNHYFFDNFETISAADITRMVGYWANASKDYNSTTGDCRNYVPPGTRCDKYKRLVWASSSELGCGMSKCVEADGPYDSERLVVCYCKPGGNVAGSQKAYQQGTPCSKCSERSGSWRCENNLCVAQ